MVHNALVSASADIFYKAASFENAPWTHPPRQFKKSMQSPHLITATHQVTKDHSLRTQLHRIISPNSGPPTPLCACCETVLFCTSQAQPPNDAMINCCNIAPRSCWVFFPFCFLIWRQKALIPILPLKLKAILFIQTFNLKPVSQASGKKKKTM